MKKLTILWITFLIIYIIYSLFNVNKINYVSLTDGVLSKYNDYVRDYLVNNNKLNSFNDIFTTVSINDLYKDIKNNRTIKDNNQEYYLKKVLRGSDVLVITVGTKELSDNFDKFDMKKNSVYFNELYSNIERLIKEIKKYAYGKIIFLGYYNPYNYFDSNIDRYFFEIDNKLNRLFTDKNITYISTYEVMKNNRYNEKLISKKILNTINMT